MTTKTTSSERRRLARVTLVGSVLLTPEGRPKDAQTAVLDNANRVGAGLHARGAVQIKEHVTVSIAFLDQEGDEQQEKLSGTVAWTKPWEKGYLIGIVWNEEVSPDRHRWLHSYLSETLKDAP